MATFFQGFRILVERSPDAISVIDTRGDILYGSASTTHLFGYQPEDLVGRSCFDLIHPEDRDDARRALHDVLAKTDQLQWDARILNKDGSYSWVESTMSNLLSEAGVEAIVVHQRNIDTRKAAEQERRQRADELECSNARLEQFAYTAAHDLREPLRAIAAYTGIIIEKTLLDENTLQMAQFVVDGTARMSRLIDDLLAFASTGMREPPQWVDLQSALDLARQNLALEIKESDARITTDPLPLIQGNEIQLVRVLQNLIGNAVKYRGKKTPEIHVGACREGLDWVIRVEDNGVGIAKENQTRVFMPFVRLANRGIPGTGLGLAVCKNIVDELGGKLSLESEAGMGATFTFTIPDAHSRSPLEAL
jgi:PAS domain S-box-containing protein